MADFSLIAQALDQGDRDKTVALTEAALGSGANPQEIIAQGLQAGMAAVGEKFSSGEYFLPDMLMAARAMKAALEVLAPALEQTGIPTIGKVVIGTVEGDMHDIGKNVVATFLSGNGFEVFDLGLNVPAQKFIDEVKEKKADILGMSALLTTTMPVMGRVIKGLEEAGLRSSVKVVVGGAPVTQDYANYIGADGYAHDGGRAVPVCRELIGK
ncbi:MAG TPA: cobalamin-binding protein [Dehalococcoidia bacterium]|nr:cobalamin-binding protein [Dehalococcoidia bacterium]